MNAHVFLVADRHASNNDAVAEDVAVRRRVCMDSDSLRSEAIAVRNTEREFLALDPFAVIGGADRAGLTTDAARVSTNFSESARRYSFRKPVIPVPRSRRSRRIGSWSLTDRRGPNADIPGTF